MAIPVIGALAGLAVRGVASAVATGTRIASLAKNVRQIRGAMAAMGRVRAAVTGGSAGPATTAGAPAASAAAGSATSSAATAATPAATPGFMARTLGRLREGYESYRGVRGLLNAVRARGERDSNRSDGSPAASGNTTNNNTSNVTNNVTNNTTNNLGGESGGSCGAGGSGTSTGSCDRGDSGGDPRGANGPGSEAFDKVTTALGRVTGGATLLVTAAAASVRALHNFSSQLSESQRYLEQYNGTIAVSFARLEMDRIGRSIKTGQATAESTKYNNEALSRLEDAMMPYQNLWTNAVQNITGAIADLGADVLNAIAEGVTAMTFGMVDLTKKTMNNDNFISNLANFTGHANQNVGRRRAGNTTPKL